jgi:hypothetical protein
MCACERVCTYSHARRIGPPHKYYCSIRTHHQHTSSSIIATTKKVKTPTHTTATRHARVIARKECQKSATNAPPVRLAAVEQGVRQRLEPQLWPHLLRHARDDESRSPVCVDPLHVLEKRLEHGRCLWPHNTLAKVGIERNVAEQLVNSIPKQSNFVKFVPVVVREGK